MEKLFKRAIKNFLPNI